LRLYHVSMSTQGASYYDAMVQRVIDAVTRGQIPAGQYGAVMIDEGHDLKPEWLKLVAQMVDPDTNALLLLYDSAQSIYGKHKRLRFSFASLGIQARGRTTILRLNYRNTTEVLAVAYEFAKEAFIPEATPEDSLAIVQPESAGRHGPVPELLRLPSLHQEADYLAERLREMHRSGRAWNDMAIVYRDKFIGEVLVERFRAARLPIEWLQESREKRYYRPNAPSIKIMTMHSSKGLEFPVVAIPGIGYMPYMHLDPHDEAQLLYVAMTRAMDHLILTAHKDSAFAVRIREARQRILAALGPFP
jgi:superfamily I DNA/RNA helicase